MRFLPRYLVLISLVVLIINQSISSILKIHYPRSFGPSFSSGNRGDYLKRINQEKPEAILLGNSIQVLAMDEELFGSIIKMQTLQFASPGAASAQYYLMIKNVITAGNLHPKYVILFFLNNMLTEPDLCVAGENYQKIHGEIATDNEPVLTQKAYINPSNLLSVWLDSNIPVLGERQRIKSKMDNKVKYSLAEILLNCDRACLDENLETIFVSENMNNVLDSGQGGDWRGKNRDFNKLVNQSFLPDVVQQLREK